MTYSTRWQRAWTFASTMGVALGFLVWSPLQVLGLFVTAVLSTGLLLAVLAPPADPRRGPAGSWWDRVGRRALGTGLVVVAISALVATMHYLVVPVLLLAAATSPWVLGRLLDQHPDRGEAPEHESLGTGAPSRSTTSPTLASVPEPSAEDLRSLSDAALCRRWRDSFAALQQARSASERSRLVELRGRCLDELDRRSPTALAAWLASGAGPSGSPERFLAEERDGRPDAA